MERRQQHFRRDVSKMHNLLMASSKVQLRCIKNLHKKQVSEPRREQKPWVVTLPASGASACHCSGNPGSGGASAGMLTEMQASQRQLNDLLVDVRATLSSTKSDAVLLQGRTRDAPLDAYLAKARQERHDSAQHLGRPRFDENIEVGPPAVLQNAEAALALAEASKLQMVTSLPFFKMVPNHRDSRCVLHPSLPRGCCVQNTSRTQDKKVLNPFVCMIDFQARATRRFLDRGMAAEQDSGSTFHPEAIIQRVLQPDQLPTSLLVDWVRLRSRVSRTISTMATHTHEGPAEVAANDKGTAAAKAAGRIPKARVKTPRVVNVRRKAVASQAPHRRPGPARTPRLHPHSPVRARVAQQRLAPTSTASHPDENTRRSKPHTPHSHGRAILRRAVPVPITQPPPARTTPATSTALPYSPPSTSDTTDAGHTADESRTAAPVTAAAPPRTDLGVSDPTTTDLPPRPATLQAADIAAGIDSNPGGGKVAPIQAGDGLPGAPHVHFNSIGAAQNPPRPTVPLLVPPALPAPSKTRPAAAAARKPKDRMAADVLTDHIMRVSKSQI